MITAPRIPGRLQRTIPIEYSFPLFGRGHKIDIDPALIPSGFTIRTYDVNLDAIGGLPQRGGIEYIADNGAGALQIANMEEAGWDANSTADATSDAGGVPRYRAFEAGGAGAASRRITTVGAETKESALAIAPVIALGADTAEWICGRVYLDDATKVTSARVQLHTVAGADFFSIVVTGLLTGWNFLMRAKSAFTSTGAPDWDSIAEVRIALTTTAATFGTFDNLWVGPAHVYGFWNFRRSLAKGGGSWMLAAARDGLFVMVPEESRFRVFPGLGERGVSTAAGAATITLAATADARTNYYRGRSIRIETGVGIGESKTITAYDAATKIATVDSAWVAPPTASRYIIGERTKGVVTNFLALNDVAIAMNGADPVESIYDDTTTYLTGIAKPLTAPTVAQVAGGGAVPAGTHTIAVAFHSSISHRDGDPIFTLPIVVAANNTRLDYSNLPVSTDGKVDWLRIYRFVSGGIAYKRVTAGLEGDVANGTTVLSDGAATGSLQNELDGAPNYDTKGVPPRSRYAAVVAGRVIYDDPAAAGRIIVSADQTAEEVPLDGIVPLDEGDNDDTRAIAEADGFAIVFKQDGFHVGRAVGGGPQPFAWQKKSTKIGCVSHRSVIVSEGVVRWRHSTGYYQMNLGWIPQKIGGGWDKQSRLPQAEPSFQDFNNALADFVCSAFLTNRDQVYWCETLTGGQFPSIQPVLHETLMGNPADVIDGDGGWAFHRAPVSVIAPARDPQTHDERIYGCGAAGIPYQFDRNYPNDSTPAGDLAIDYDPQMAFLDQREKQFGLGPGVLKRYKWVDFIMRSGGNWPLDLTAYYDWAIGQSQGAAGGTVASATALTLVLAAGPSQQDDIFNGLRITVRSLTTGLEQDRAVIDYDGVNRRLYIDSAWTVNPAAADEWVIYRRLFSTGSVTPNLGPGLGSTFALGLSPLGGSGGSYQRAALSTGRRRSISLRFRNNRLNEAPYIGSIYLHVIRQRPAGRIG